MTALDTDQQIDKLQQAMRLAEQAAASGETASRLGALVLYAGIIDFLAIQAARLVEQIVIKGQLAQGQQPAFMPNDNSFFYKRKMSTARILKDMRKLLPFADASGEKRGEPARVTKFAETMIGRGLAFLDHRDPLLHQIGNPSRTFDDVLGMVAPAIAAYHAFREAHKTFFEATGPYRFGPEEMEFLWQQAPMIRKLPNLRMIPTSS